MNDCMGHFNEKHGGSAFFELKNVQRFFPPCTVTRDMWQMALCPDVSGIAVDTRLFHEAGCRLVHKYRVYKDPFPHPALREGEIPRLLSFVAWVIWLLPSSFISTSRFLHRGFPRVRYRPSVFWGASTRELCI